MEKIVSKGMRLEMPVNVSCRLRPEVYHFLSVAAKESHCAVSVLVRGIIEDFFDRSLAVQQSDVLYAASSLDVEV